MESITQIKSSNGDRVMKTTIIYDDINSFRDCYVFTIMRTNLVAVIKDNDRLILLMNRRFKKRLQLERKFNELIIAATTTGGRDEFLMYMDTYIYVDNIICNETIDEIINTYDIISKDF